MKHVTALYATRDAAERVRDEIIAQDVEPSHVRLIPSAPGEVNGSSDDMEALHGIGLSDDDVRVYQNAVRHGDTVVTAHVDDEKAGLVEEAMRDPNHGLDVGALRARHADDQLIAPAGKPLGAVGSTSTIGAADDGRTTYRDPMAPRE